MRTPNKLAKIFERHGYAAALGESQMNRFCKDEVCPDSDSGAEEGGRVAAPLILCLSK